MTVVCIALGSNLAAEHVVGAASPDRVVAAAIRQIDKMTTVGSDSSVTLDVRAISSFWRSRSLDADGGRGAQPDYCNAVILCEWRLCDAQAPVAQSEQVAVNLLRGLQKIEADFGRDRSAQSTRWAPRTLDLDLISVGDMEMASAFLTLPHPLAATRDFVMVPLAEIAAAMCLPGIGRVDDCVATFAAPRNDMHGLSLQKWLPE